MWHTAAITTRDAGSHLVLKNTYNKGCSFAAQGLLPSPAVGNPFFYCNLMNFQHLFICRSLPTYPMTSWHHQTNSASCCSALTTEDLLPFRWCTIILGRRNGGFAHCQQSRMWPCENQWFGLVPQFPQCMWWDFCLSSSTVIRETSIIIKLTTNTF